ncbi:phosphoethanolamine transferase [Caldimonas sp. KR1-144]|uniref:phosphoethanolamine transferase n=1 Tax=Caldimonas sp. KR1-144 TaxID=3400911 RepID=UPI003BFCD17F
MAISSTAVPADRAPDAAQRDWHPITLVFLAGLWIAAAANWPLWRALAALPEMHGLRFAVFGASMFVAVAALTALVLLPLSSRRVLRPAITLFLLAAAFGAYFMSSYGVVIDPTMMVNVLQTDVRETRDLLSLRMALTVVAVGVLPALWLWRQPLRAPTGRWPSRVLVRMIAAAALLAAIVGLGYANFQTLSSTTRNHKELRYLINPLNSVYALGRIAFAAQARPAGPPQPIGLDARLLAAPPGAKPPLVLLVVGETARADHFALNGYERPTNPELSRIEGLVSFRQVRSCGTSTAASLPCMFSPLGRQAFLDRQQDSENLVDLLQRAGLAVLWLDNQSGCKGLCERVPHASTAQPAPGQFSAPGALCHGGECLDEALLYDLDARIAALDAQRRARGVVVVLHQMGSHGPAYASRSPAERKPFAPECTSNVLQDCASDALVNAYDNSIVYTDHVLSQAVAWLAARNDAWSTAMLYVSDHGESLGENGLYLHGVPYAIAPQAQTHVPMLLWLGSGAKRALGVDGSCLERLRDAPLSHDNLFHTTLGLAGVRASEYRSELDAIANCRTAG